MQLNEGVVNHATTALERMREAATARSVGHHVNVQLGQHQAVPGLPEYQAFLSGVRFPRRSQVKAYLVQGWACEGLIERR